MIRKFFAALFFLICWYGGAMAQQRDSTLSSDTAKAAPPSLRKDSSYPLADTATHRRVHKKAPDLKVQDTLTMPVQTNPSFPTEVVGSEAPTQPDDTAFGKALGDHPWFNFFAVALRPTEEIHKAASYEGMFYLVVFLLFYFALIKTLFGKYLANLLTLFFRASMRQQQIREQVVQSPLPSLALNLLFFISTGLYLNYLLRFYGIGLKADFWALFGYLCALLGAIYLVKFCLLKSAGWIFNIQRVTDSYIFTVFMTNKVVGIFLLPFVVTLSFSGAFLSEIAITASLLMLVLLYARRFVVSFGPVRKEINVNGLHFILYLCAFEIAPLLLIYKVLLTYLKKAY